LTWSVEDAVSVTVTGPGVYSTEKSASIVPCPGVFDTEKQRCHPERGEHVYTLTATDEYGRSVTEQVTLSIGVNDDAGNPETPADPDTGASPPNPPSAPTTTTPPNEKPDKPEKPEKPDKPEKPEKPERPERKRKPDEG
jgi:hypothetical protein